MKKITSILALITLGFALSAKAQTLVISNFTGWAATPAVSPWVGFNNGWATSGNGTLTTQGGAGSFQFIDDTNFTALDFSAYDTLNLTVDITALDETSPNNSSLFIRTFDENAALIQTFQFDLSSNLAGGNVTLSGSLLGDYTGVAYIEFSTDLSVPDGDSFSASFSSFYLTAIPEPSTYALLALGAGAIGIMVRRRRKA